VPFTTGILVGIGETREDRIAALEAIAASHLVHGHVQEVIVQNFLPKPGTGMQHEAPCPQDEFLWSIAVARLILPAEIHLQAPPNLSDDFGAARCGHRRLGWRLARHARPRQPRAAVAGPRPAA
jgi:FO synthase